MPCINMSALVVAIGATTVAGGLLGRCPGSSYMNVAFGGMTKEKCLQRAYEVNQGPGPSGPCGHVSYSASAGPQGKTDFCQCHKSCEGPLDQPAGEEWKTYITSKPSDTLVIVLISSAALVGALLLCLAIACCYRRRKAGAGSVQCKADHLSQVDANSNQADSGQVEGNDDAPNASNV